MEKTFHNLVESNRNKIVFTIFPIELEPIGIPYVVKSIEKWYIQPDFAFVQQDSQNISLHVQRIVRRIHDTQITDTNVFFFFGNIDILWYEKYDHLFIE